mmetsp:Transcript_26414/g.62996  ORF Transcript_26414/g.62996 Transcript_26414/m.62996 type:complete len:206 (+) Transcript_26414:820-1437(+)
MFSSDRSRCAIERLCKCRTALTICRATGRSICSRSGPGVGPDWHHSNRSPLSANSETKNVSLSLRKVPYGSHMKRKPFACKYLAKPMSTHGNSVSDECWRTKSSWFRPVHVIGIRFTATNFPFERSFCSSTLPWFRAAFCNKRMCSKRASDQGWASPTISMHSSMPISAPGSTSISGSELEELDDEPRTTPNNGCFMLRVVAGSL